MKKLFKNQRGFGHHIIMPLLVILVVASVGGYVVYKARATRPDFVFRRGDFGITPGSGTFLSPDTLQANLTDFSNLGARWVRSSILWKSFEPTAPKAGQAPVFDWSKVDAFTATLNNATNVNKYRIIVTVDGPPTQWSKPSTIQGCGVKNVNDTSDPGNQVPFNLDQYAAAVGALASHLKNQNIHVFELENSPNIGSHAVDDPDNPTRGLWTDANPCAYAQLLQKSYNAIHGTPASPNRPDAVVLVGGIGGTSTQADNNGLNVRMPADDFLAAIYNSPEGKACGGKSCFDGVAYHAYSFPSEPCSDTTKAQDPNACYASDPTHVDPKGANGPKSGWDRMVNAHNIMTAKGDGDKRVWVTEYGYPGGVPGDNRYSEAKQSDDITLAYQQASKLSWLGPLCIYTLKDGTDVAHTYSKYFGLEKVVNGKTVPKLAYTNAYQKLTAPFKDSGTQSSDSDTSEF